MFSIRLLHSLSDRVHTGALFRVAKESFKSGVPLDKGDGLFAHLSFTRFHSSMTAFAVVTAEAYQTSPTPALSKAVAVTTTSPLGANQTMSRMETPGTKG